ncbi:glycosyl hydrolase [Gaoshiqia sp. Z1-71]|uniref:glycosyl hydrolase n=1 Tax=Gaoshiqia hydrogeniformans TaxID=3290090 RepID=UPI003BF828FB
MKRNLDFIGFFVFLTVLSCVPACQKPQPVTWPEITRETKPWTRWWWHGSAVNPADLTANMEELQKAGFGGVEITPIYDVKGSENLSISFQSDEWMNVFEHTLKEAQRLNLGIDLANASGWPFGGPWIQAEDACKNMQFKQFSLKEGERLTEKVEFIQQPLVRAVGKRVDISEVKFPVSSNTNLQELALDQVRFEKPLPLQTLMAYSDGGEILELTDRVVADGTLDWTAPPGNWKLYAVFQGWHGKMVERAGTGGEGNVIDHFSETAARRFLKDFDDNASQIDLTGLRAFFNDSYEVDDAQGESNWTPLFFEEFAARRGYDLKQYLPALFGNGSEEMNSRVLCDYRETISDLLLDRFTIVWADWAKTHGVAIRNQAHGSPANILDLYGASDIPETEGTQPMRIKMATSAGHVSGKPLIACEAATWLNEHFLSDLGDAKQNFDRYLAHGVNHLVYHGTPYSPRDEAWPGWLFYASVHFGPTNPWWNDLKALNDYVANCQSFMQKSIPDNDLLLYFPIYDSWSEKGRSMLKHFGGPHEPVTEAISHDLLAKGYSFDYISDKQIQKLTVEKKRVKAPGATYKTILVPRCEYMPLETLQKLADLTKAGATVIFHEKLPVDVPGLADLETRQQAFDNLKQSFAFESKGQLLACRLGNGRLLMSDEIDVLLTQVNMFPEEAALLGLWFNRVKRTEGTCYFLANWSGQPVDQWMTVQASGKQAVWFNPMNRTMGKARVQKAGDHQSKVYVQLAPGETLILQWFPAENSLADYPFWKPAGEKLPFANDWTVSFVKGGPTLPEAFQTSELKSWTDLSDELTRFSGTASYKTIFKKPGVQAPAYRLDLGEVAVSAAVYLNGEKLGTLVGPTYQLSLPVSLLQETNELEIQVSNLMANRIIDMDKNGVNYKKFYNINFAANKRENLGPDGLFTAAHWEPLPSGLLGPVSLTPLQAITP